MEWSGEHGRKSDDPPLVPTSLLPHCSFSSLSAMFLISRMTLRFRNMSIVLREPVSPAWDALKPFMSHPARSDRLVNSAACKQRAAFQCVRCRWLHTTQTGSRKNEVRPGRGRRWLLSLPEPGAAQQCLFHTFNEQSRGPLLSHPLGKYVVTFANQDWTPFTYATCYFIFCKNCSASWLPCNREMKSNSKIVQINQAPYQNRFFYQYTFYFVPLLLNSTFNPSSDTRLFLVVSANLSQQIPCCTSVKSRTMWFLLRHSGSITLLNIRDL